MRDIKVCKPHTMRVLH